MFVCYALGIRDGFTFLAGVIDYVLNRNYATHGWWIIPIGLIFGVIYFVVFYFSIKAFDIKTPGREDEDASGPVGGDSSLMNIRLRVTRTAHRFSNLCESKPDVCSGQGVCGSARRSG